MVGRRLARLGEETNRALTFTAAFTAGFDFGVLQAVSRLDEDVLLDCIDEALAARLIRTSGSAPARYDFAHALVRHTLYDALNPDRRARLHRHIAAALARVHAGHVSAHAAEIAVQYHASAFLPGAEAGIPYCLTAAEQATTGYAYEQAVTFLRMARDLAAQAPAAVRAGILCELAVVGAEALMLDVAQRSVEEALAALASSGAESTAVAGFVTVVARALKDSGESPRVWEPLVERGLALIGDGRDLTWARLMLLRDPSEPVSTGPINAGRWLGHDPQAVAIARASGNETDYAGMLEPFDHRGREETEAVLALARTWQRPAAVMRALNVGARELLYRHGAFHEATVRLEDLLAAGER